MAEADKNAAITQIDAALSRFDEITAEASGDEWLNISTASTIELETVLTATVERLAPRGSRYRETVQEAIGSYSNYHPEICRSVRGVLQALRVDYEAGYLRSLEELIHADLFADFLDMARHLLDNGYKDAAAVIVGSSLEGHLRQLAAKAGVATQKADGRPRTADSINGSLGAGTYSKGDLKAVTAWLDTRNNAAHAHYDKYDEQQVSLMLDGVRDFMRRNPA